MERGASGVGLQRAGVVTMRPRICRAVAAAAYVAYVAFMGWSALDPRSVQSACLIAFGVLCALPAFLAGQRSPRTPRRVSSSPVYPD